MLATWTGSSATEAIQSIASKLFHDEPQGDFELDAASVAVIFRSGGGVKTLLIKRAERVGDPWSGQVAFPGGRVAAGDRSFRETAVRETREEMGFDLTSSRFLGYLGVFKARTRGMMVVPSVFALDSRVAISRNREVASCRWIPLRSFESDSSRSIFYREYDGVRLGFPSYSVGGYVIWGLTERIISTLVSYL